MKGRKRTPEQIVRNLREAERIIPEGTASARLPRRSRSATTRTCAAAAGTPEEQLRQRMRKSGRAQPRYGPAGSHHHHVEVPALVVSGRRCRVPVGLAPFGVGGWVVQLFWAFGGGGAEETADRASPSGCDAGGNTDRPCRLPQNLRSPHRSVYLQQSARYCRTALGRNVRGAEISGLPRRSLCRGGLPPSRSHCCSWWVTAPTLTPALRTR